DNVLMSVVLRPPYGLAESWRLAFVAAVAVADALDGCAVAPSLKWPNDVLVEGRKCGGVLVEVCADAGGWAAVVGIGLNVNQLRFDVDPTFDLPPTSRRLATGREQTASTIALDVAVRLMEVEGVHRREGFTPIAERWRARMAPGLEIRRGPSRGIQTYLEDDG